ncbi:Beta-glucanase precursor [Actinomyces bovis]|uniref:Beta-glucanase n=1 Tax=Actinomyces bovis TaxID=1658 RepID=A0ABY1VQM7_9ACTO|nr:glycoside hydrolase family 16 protein [Actinomyces bovis]SPT54052.1 Beta-glucanase precursor [Actinomyces bovis]VEG53774.1 Beta-glucanase precursor [Actinomyces israelii]
MRAISRRSALAGASVGVGVAAASILSPTSAFADGYKYVWKRSINPGETIEETIGECGPDQVVQAKWLYDYSQAPATIYISTAVRQEGKTCYRALVHNTKGNICLRLERCDEKGAKVLAEGPSVPVASYTGRREWILRTTITGNKLEATVDGVAALKLSATDSTIAQGTNVSQTYYLSKQAKTATDIRGNSLKVTSTGSTAPKGFSKLIFEDTFSTGTDFDPTKWAEKYPDWDPAYVKYDWGVNTHDAHRVRDGLGQILWRKRAVPITKWPNPADVRAGVQTVRDVDTANLVTLGKFAFTYGRMEVRVRFPQSHVGLWGGIWMRPTKGDDGEIDLAESWGGGVNTGKVSADVHYSYDSNMKNRHNPKLVEPKPDLTQFHVFAVEKTPDRITFYFDGKKFHEVLSTEYPDRWARAFGPDTPYYLRLCSQAGDTPQTKIDTKTFTEASMDIDYIRVWEMDK